MAKYDWKKLEREFILSDFKSVSAFLKFKGIKRSGNVQKAVKGWNEKKVQKEFKKGSKIIEKVIEKESENESQKILKVKDVANTLLMRIVEAESELNKHIAKRTKKTKIVKYDYITNKPAREIISENEEIKEYTSIIDRKGLKEVTSALKDLNDILNVKQGDNDGKTLADVIQEAYEEKRGNEDAN